MSRLLVLLQKPALILSTTQTKKPTFLGSWSLKYFNFYKRRSSNLIRSLKSKDANWSVSIFERLCSQLSPSSWQSKTPPKWPVERILTSTKKGCWKTPNAKKIESIFGRSCDEAKERTKKVIAAIDGVTATLLQSKFEIQNLIDQSYFLFKMKDIEGTKKANAEW